MDSKIKNVLSHFRKRDPKLFSIAKNMELKSLESRRPKEFFSSLCYEIVGQQLNKRVARIIFARFEELFPKRKISPECALKFSDEKLRKTGMSWAKVSFIKDLSEKVMSKSLDIKNLHKLNNDKATEKLKLVKGVGPWTAEMFLIFTLGREDIFSTKDLRLKKAIKNIYELQKNATKEEIEKITIKWSPYRSYACRILWNNLNNE